MKSGKSAISVASTLLFNSTLVLTFPDLREILLSSVTQGFSNQRTRFPTWVTNLESPVFGQTSDSEVVGRYTILPSPIVRGRDSPHSPTLPSRLLGAAV